MAPIRSTLPFIFLPLCVASVALSAGILGLSVVNFGLLSRWYNAAAAVLTIAFHFALFFLIWKKQRRSSRPNFILATPTTQDQKLSKEVEAPSHTESSNALPTFHTIHNVTTLLCLTLLNLIYLIAFGIMMDITIRGGAKSTLPAERAPGMTRPWNIKVQIAQVSLIGLESIVMLAILATAALDRSKIAAVHEERREDIEYGLESSEKHQIDL